MARHERTFFSVDEAEAFIDGLPDSERHDSDSVVYDGNGAYIAKWGGAGSSDPAKAFWRDWSEDQQVLEQQHVEDCTWAARRVVAERIAAERGLEGADAHYFVEGFSRSCIKRIDPRAAGKADVFKTARAASFDPESERAVRVELVVQLQINKRHVVRPAVLGGPGGCDE